MKDSSVRQLTFDNSASSFHVSFYCQATEEKEHFSTYALNAKTGRTHWKHEPGDYEAKKMDREVSLLFISVYYASSNSAFCV